VAGLEVFLISKETRLNKVKPSFFGPGEFKAQILLLISGVSYNSKVQIFSDHVKMVSLL
jgi:hypothetical protein